MPDHDEYENPDRAPSLLASNHRPRVLELASTSATAGYDNSSAETPTGFSAYSNRATLVADDYRELSWWKRATGLGEIGPGSLPRADQRPMPAGFDRSINPAVTFDKAQDPSKSTIWLQLAAAYLGVAVLIRGLTLGNPALHIDEQFYLLVGDRLLHGVLPYVDIWDRKPIGLFVLYAAIRTLGGEGIFQYQIAALLSAAATALTVNRIARTIAPAAGAWWAGVAYLLYLSAYNCFGGQSPVFYNLLVALAALQTCRIVTSSLEATPRQDLLVRGTGVMALIGIAIQIKYTVIFEGIAFGLVLLMRAHVEGLPRARMFGTALAWIGAALAPTMLALAVYIWLGHGSEFIFANFESIFQRAGEGDQAWWRLTKEMAALTPFWLAIFHAPTRLAPEARAGMAHPNSAALPFLRFWGFAAIGGFLIFGTWYDHYVAPLLAPLAVLAAPALGATSGKLRVYPRLLIGFGVIAAGYLTIHEMTHHATTAQIDRLSNLIQSHLDGGCAYLNEGDTVLYMKTNSCLASPYIFPNHLAGMVDTYSIGVNVNHEVSRIMASHPTVVMIGVKPSSKPINWESRAIIFSALARDYTLFAVVPAGSRQFLLYRLNSGFKSTRRTAVTI